MRYHYDKPTTYHSMYGITHSCDHPVYSNATLFKIGERGLCVIQQRYDSETKTTSWGEIDPWLTDDIYLHPKFKEFFNERSSKCIDKIYPTATIRQVMWALKMKPLKRERWETCFDRRNI